MTSGVLAAPRCVMLRLMRGRARRRSTSAMSGVRARRGLRDVLLDAAEAIRELHVVEIGEGGARRGGIERAIAVMRHRAHPWAAPDRTARARYSADELGNRAKRMHLAGRDIEHPGRAAHQHPENDLGEIVDQDVIA